MLVPGSSTPLLAHSAAAAATGISRSLRFNSSDSAYLSRTPGSTTTAERRTWTFSFWIKRTKVATEETILDASATGQYPQGRFGFTSGDKLNFFWYDGSTVYSLETAAVYRDFSAWYHVLIAFDSTQATSANRTKIYINGTEQTLSGSYVAQNTNTDINNTVKHVIGFYQYVSAHYINSYLADVYMIAGQQLDPSSFTETDATTGQLVPKAYTGSYGTNGFHLTFSDNSGTTSTTLGKDSAGSNNWTPNNFSVASGSGNDSLVDVPTSSGTDSGVGGEVRGNYSVLNPLKTTFSGDGGNPSYSNGNLDVTGSSGTSNAINTIGVSSGKFYFECTLTATTDSNAFIIGLNQSPSAYSGNFGLRPSGSFPNGTITSGSAFTFTVGDTVGIAYEPGVSATFYKNNNTSSFVASLSSGTWFSWAQLGGTGVSAVFNFGQRPFINQSVPSGFKALCTANLPAPLVTKPSTVMDVVLYTGTGSSLTLPYASSTPTSIAFTPDLVWIKGRSGATDHALYDAVRDVQKDLVSNSTAAETTQSTGLTAFGTNTFTIGSLAKLNTSSATYAAWCWDAGSSTVTNTQGSITTTVRANPTAGFSIVGYTGSGSAITLGHGLNAVPSFAIFKRRDGTGDWSVYHQSIPGGALYWSLYLNQTSAAENNFWGPSDPTSTLFSMYASRPWNVNGASMIGYFWAPVSGYTSISSYTGNGSSDGVFVFTGMRPRFIMIKRTDTTSNWTIIDTAREGYNVDNDPLYPNLSDAEGTADLADILSNGFKLRSSDASVNASSGTYIYAAFAESPFNYSRAR